MDISRRTFIQSAVAGGACLSAFGFDATPVYAQAKTLKIARTSETRSTCPYCSVSCGLIIHTLGDRAKNAIPQVVHVEGDPDHPINRGTLCPKGAALHDFVTSKTRITVPRVREPGSDEWTEVSWDHALDRIARMMKDDRDANFIAKNKDGTAVNRWTTVGFLGASATTNETAFLTYKAVRSMGILGFDNQARV